MYDGKHVWVKPNDKNWFVTLVFRVDSDKKYRLHKFNSYAALYIINLVVTGN